MKEFDDMPQNDCPYRGTQFAYECPFYSHGVCFESSPCDGPDGIRCYDEVTEFTEEHFKAVERRTKIRKVANLIVEFAKPHFKRNLGNYIFVEQLAAYLIDKGGV